MGSLIGALVIGLSLFAGIKVILKVRDVQTEKNQEYRLKILASALENYESKVGSLPVELQDLVPEFLDQSDFAKLNNDNYSRNEDPIYIGRPYKYQGQSHQFAIHADYRVESLATGDSPERGK